MKRAAAGALALLLLWGAGTRAAAASEERPPQDGPLEARAERGPVSAVVRVTPEAPVIGDPIELELEVRAEPEVELLMPEFGEALDRFAVVDFAPAEEIAEDGATLSRQRYTLHPSRSGPQSIPPLLVEFVDRRPGREPAPEGEDAFELLTPRLDFEVSSVLPEDAPLELRAALAKLPPRPEPGAPRWPWIAGGVLLLAAAAPFVFRGWLAHRAERLRRSAYEIARSELDALLYGPRPEDPRSMDAYFVTLSGIVRRYVEGRFGLHAPELTTEEFLDELSRSPDLYASHKELLRAFLQRADLVKFAHHVPEAGAVDESVQAAERFIRETGEAARA